MLQVFEIGTSPMQKKWFKFLCSVNICHFLCLPSSQNFKKVVTFIFLFVSQRKRHVEFILSHLSVHTSLYQRKTQSLWDLAKVTWISTWILDCSMCFFFGFVANRERTLMLVSKLKPFTQEGLIKKCILSLMSTGEARWWWWLQEQ